MATIQLLVTESANRRALTSVIADRHTVLTDADLQAADLYLVDDTSLPQYHEALEAHKDGQAPVFCPVVLIRRDRTPITVKLPSPDTTETLLVNDVLTAPVEQEILARRITNLLERRRQTTELHETNERLEQFASILRHELRNPLTVLDGYLDIARDQESSKAFERCRRAVNQMKQLLDDTTLILEDEPRGAERETVRLADVCRECWEAIQAEEADLAIDGSQTIRANRIRLSQLLSNLFRNAVDHGGDSVTVTVGTLDEGFYVADDGPGIPEEERETVFEEGYSTSIAGSGLGLAVVKAVADAHGWDIRVTDGSDGGARFEITSVESADR